MKGYGDVFLGNKDYQSNLIKILNNTCYSVVLKGFSNELFNSCLNLLKEFGLIYTNAICSKLLEIINKNMRNSHSASVVFEFMNQNDIQPNIVTLNSIMECYCLTGRFDQAYAVFTGLVAKGFKPDSYTYSTMIKGVKNMDLPDIDLALRIFEQYKAEDFDKNTVIYNNIIDLLVSSGEIDKADQIFNEIFESDDLGVDQITFNTLIKGCYKKKDLDNAIKYYKMMKASSFVPNRITYNSLMDLAVKVEKMGKALSLLEDMQKDKIMADGFTYSIILNGLKINNSGVALVRSSLETIKKVLDNAKFKLDEVIFNSIFDVCSKYDLFDQLSYFYDLMRFKHVNESVITYGILLKAYCKTGEYEKTLAIFDNMRAKNMGINEVIYGHVLDCCTKAGKMDIALKIYENLKKSDLGISSIVFTTLLTGFVKKESYDKGMDFFMTIKDHTDLPGMLITYNCALDILVRKNDMSGALELFDKIDEVYGADLISYSTIIKGLCLSNRKSEALERVKEMIGKFKDLDISVVNLFLDSCATPKDFKLGIQGYQYSMMKNVTPNEVTFGIMVKIFGFSRELRKAFDLLDLMAVYEISPSIIIFTNLVHISFYNSNPRKAELAYTLFKRKGLKGDKLLYSKLIDGFIRYKELKKVPKYINLAMEEEVGLKPDTYEKIGKKFGNDKDIMDKLKKLKEFGKKPEKHQYNTKSDRYKPNNPPKPQSFKRPGINSKKSENPQNPSLNNENKKFTNSRRRGFEDNKINKQATFSNTGAKNFNKKPLALFNFRKKS